MNGQLGLEKTPEEYVERMVGVFREVKRVLRDDGTLWLNLGDSYNANGRGGHGGTRIGYKQGTNRASAKGDDHNRPSAPDLKPKDLVGIPWMVAFALRADGWYLRSDIIWSKPNPMPESVTDRPTKSHEYLFLLTKSQRYYFDQGAVKEAQCEYEKKRRIREHEQGLETIYKIASEGKTGLSPHRGAIRSAARRGELALTGERNIRTVWTVATQPWSEAHFATFPEKLVEPCVKAGTSERGCCPKCGGPWVRVVERKGMVIARSSRTHELGRTRSSGTMLEPAESKTTGWRPSCDCGEQETVRPIVLDPFAGSGTVGVVCSKLNRKFVGLELKWDYCRMATRRIKSTDVAMF